MQSAEELFQMAFDGSVEESRRLLLIGELPKNRYKMFSLDQFPIRNDQNKTIRNCQVWFADGQFKNISTIVKFNVLENIEDCTFYFFRTPLKSSKLVFDLKGQGHVAINLSKQRMNSFARLIRKNSTLAIGEGVHIGGCKIALDETLIRIGAGGLWSDGILVQGTDSHGILEIDTKKIINDGPKHVTFGRRVWIGRDVRIMKNVTIDDGSIVGTGAMVTKSIPKACVAVGFPAKVVKERISWSGRPDMISAFETAEIDKLKKLLAPPRAITKQAVTLKIAEAPTGPRQQLWNTLWLKAAAAGFAGAGVFEVIRWIAPDF